MNKIFRSKAPLRIGLAGGGTDVSPYSDIYGGAILNATVSLFAHAAIEPTNDGRLTFHAADIDIKESFDVANTAPLTDQLNLLKGVYNRIQKDFGFECSGLRLTTFVDAPPGSGLGTSSTLVVAIIGAFVEMLNLPLGEYDIARYAYDIERKDLGLAGGKQDQYAATFGGVNYMEFMKDDKTIVNPLRIKRRILHELENNIVLFYTDTSRESAQIITEQVKNVNNKNQESIEAMHHLKEQAVMMKEALLRGELDKLGTILDYGFEQKRKMAKNISNSLIESIYASAKSAGATGGKISGAGGGGFMLFYCPHNSRYEVIRALSQYGGKSISFQFIEYGLTTWNTKITPC